MEPQDYLLGLLKQGLTQDQIASETGIPQPTLSRLARGVTKDLPSRRTRKLAALHELRVVGPAEREEQKA